MRTLLRWLRDYWAVLNADPFAEEIPLLPQRKRADPLGLHTPAAPYTGITGLRCPICGEMIAARQYSVHQYACEMAKHIENWEG